jgi:hypothetical protein
MSGWILFFIGLTVSSICLAGLVFTIVEVRRLGREADERALSTANGAEGATAHR